MNRKEKGLAIKSALTSRVAANKIVVLDSISFDEVKTKKFVAVLENLKVNKALVVLDKKDENVILSARNIPTVRTALSNAINVYDIVKYDTLVITKDAVAQIEEVYA
jgi:large subunit ribosomal protein L4